MNMNITRGGMPPNVIPFPVARAPVSSIHMLYPTAPLRFEKKIGNQFEYELKTTPQQTLALLRNAVDEDKLQFAHTQSGGWLFGMKPGKKDFIGEFDGNTFRVMKRIAYNNPHTPILEGRVIPTPAGNTRVLANFTILPATETFTKRLLILGKALEYLGKAMGRNEERALIKFINQLFNGIQVK